MENSINPSSCPPFKRILVPLDGSACAAAALDEAIGLAAGNGGRLHLVHVVDELRHLSGFESARAYLDEALPRMRSQGERLLAAGRQKAAARGVEAEGTVLVSGAPRVCEQVAGQARLAHCDLIVVGTHGRRGMDRFLMGSDAEQIVRHAPVPVLLVRQQSGAS